MRYAERIINHYENGGLRMESFVTLLSGVLLGAILPLVFRILDHTRLKSKIEIYNSWYQDGASNEELHSSIDEEVSNLDVTENDDDRRLLYIFAFLMILEGVVCIAVSRCGIDNIYILFAAVLLVICAILLFVYAKKVYPKFAVSSSDKKAANEASGSQVGETDND